MEMFKLNRVISLSLIVTFTDGKNVYPRKININQLDKTLIGGLSEHIDQIKNFDSFIGNFYINTEKCLFNIETI